MKRKSCGILALAAISTISLPITTVDGAKLSSSKIRGGNTIDTTLHNNNSGKKRTRHDITNKRLPIQDSHQKEKILKWNLLQQQQQLLLKVENIDDKVGRVQDDISESPLDHTTPPEHDEERKLSTSIHHKKTSDYGFVSVEHAKPPPSQPATAPTSGSNLNNIIANSMNGDKSPDDEPQAQPPSPAVVIDGGSSHAMLPYGSAATHTSKTEPSSTNNESSNNNNNDSSNNSMSYWENYIAPMTSQTSTSTTNNNDSSNNMSSYSSGVTHSKSEPVEALYYPIFIKDSSSNSIVSGTCTNLDKPPKKYHNPTRFSKFMYNSKEECCISWYTNPYTCLTSQSTIDTHDQLLKRNPTTGNINKYYPIFDMNKYPNGACINNGMEPEEYVNTESVQYLFIEMKYCCGTWFMDEELCLAATESSMEQQSQSVGNGEFISDADLLQLEEAMVGMTSYGHTTLDSSSSSTSSKLYYPSLNTNLYPNGACLHDGNQPSAYNTNNNNGGGMKYLFQTEKECCDTWFMEGELCLMASVTNNDDNGSNGSSNGWLDTTPSPTPDETYMSPWPTWSDDDEIDEPSQQQDTPQTLDFIPADASDSFKPNTNYKHTSQSPQIVFYESFESGDFTKYDWSRPTSPTDTYNANNGYIEIDKWEADRTGIAYHGNYAARPGIISTPNGQSNLTISLEDLDTSSNGGLLSYSIHASVEMPIDVVYFSINDRLLHVYDKVTGSSGSDQYSNGEWETASVLLQPGEHVLTWSYQYYGMPSPTDSNYDVNYVMDPRRVGNTWLDDITFELFTGDVIYSDNGDDTKSLLYNDEDESEDIRMIWSLASDTNAYLGTHSYIAHTNDIQQHSGSSEISWTIIAGPSGGILSFAIFANVYAPHDLLEFSVDGIPEVLFTTISSGWEQKYIQVEGGKHTVKWKLIKNVAGLSSDVLEDVNVPDDYEGYVKVDGIMFLDNQVHYDNAAAVDTAVVKETTTKATQPIITTTEKPEVVTTTTSTTTRAETTTTTITSTTTTATEEEVITPNYAVDGCPDGLHQVEGLPNCCIDEPNYLGDGACDPWGPYNTADCAYDLGDCCYETCNHDSPYGCMMKDGNDDEVGPFGFFCLDPRYSVIDETRCDVENREWIGDGGCDADGGYNTEECKFLFLFPLECFKSRLVLTSLFPLVLF